MIGVGGAQTGNLPARLGEDRGVEAVGVDHAPDRGKGPVERGVGRRAGGRPEPALHHLALRIHDHYLGRRQRIVRHA